MGGHQPLDVIFFDNSETRQINPFVMEIGNQFELMSTHRADLF